MNEQLCKFIEQSDSLSLCLMIDATNACQLKCRYCYFGEKHKRIMNVTRTLRAAMNICQALPKVSEVTFHYMGGEPLLAWNQIVTLNQEARRQLEKRKINFSWSLTSNLVALDEAKVKHMIGEKANIHCSFDGPADIHNRNRPFANGKPSFETVVKNIPLALRITPTDVARVTVCPEDTQRLPEIALTVLDKGFDTVGLFPAHNWVWTQGEIDKWGDAIGNTVQQVQKKQPKKRISTLYHKHRYSKKSKREFSYCGAGKTLWAINVDGYLSFCHHLTNTDNYHICDASANEPETIYSAMLKSNTPPKTGIPEKCQECPIVESCDGNCWVDSLLANRNSNIPDNTDCRLRLATVEALSPLDQIIAGCDYCDYGERSENKPCYGCHRCDSCIFFTRCKMSCQECHTCQGCDDCEKACQSAQCSSFQCSWCTVNPGE